MESKTLEHINGGGLNGFSHKEIGNDHLFTNQIGNELKTILRTEDVGVIIDAKHLCVSSRGVQDHTSATVTTFYSGLLNSPEKIAELQNYIKS